MSSKGQINATRITAIVAGQEDSDYVEVRTRLFPSQSSILRCDVLINGKTYYFNYTEEKIQIFSSKFDFKIFNCQIDILFFILRRLCLQPIHRYTSIEYNNYV